VSKKKSGKARKPQQRQRSRHLRSVPSGGSLGGPEEQAAPQDSPESQELFQTLRRALRSDQPLDLLMTVSALVNATDDRMRDPFAREDTPRTTLEQLVDSFVGVDYAETTAALTVLEALVPDELLAARIGKVLKGRRQPMPQWLDDLRAVRPGRVVEMTNVLGDGDDYFVEVNLSGQPMTALVYVDHNMGGIVKDAFMVPDTVDSVKAVFVEKVDDPETTFADVDPAVARAEVEAAIEQGARTYPQPVTDTWPAVRPLVEWLVRMLPAGGEPRRAEEWSEEELTALLEDFFASPYGRKLDGPDERGLVEDFTWYASGWGSGDPVRWSVVRVEILLTDWIPRKIVADLDYLAKAPALLRAFIAYCHDRVQLRQALTDEVIAAVDRWEPEYQRLIRSERPQGAEALARMVLESSPYADGEYDDEDDLDLADLMLESLDRCVGGRDALLKLDTLPLPDEPFEWREIPEDVHDRVLEVLELCDTCADELFDVEHRTAFRRFLGRAAAADPAIFRRKSAANRAAAAVCWAVGRANGSVSTPGGIEARRLEDWFGVKGSVSDRAQAFLAANGVDRHDRWGAEHLGTPDLLTGARRSKLAELRDRYLSWQE
jgi:hypothetical protein